MEGIVVLFEVKPTKEGLMRYLELAKMLKSSIASCDGIVSSERFSSLSEDGKLLSMSIWRDIKAVEKWRNCIDHRMCQKEGREKLFESYQITVCSSIRSYSLKNREEAPSDSNSFFMENEK